MPFDIFSTRAQLAAIELMPREYSFLFDTFVQDGGAVEEEKAIFDYKKGDRQMALDELADLGPDVVEKFGSRGVEVIGVAVNQQAAEAQTTALKAEAKFQQLVDADGKAFEQVGSQMLPWTLVLDADGKIVWFDLEYSHSTRRELQQALLATVR